MILFPRLRDGTYVPNQDEIRGELLIIAEWFEALSENDRNSLKDMLADAYFDTKRISKQSRHDIKKWAEKKSERKWKMTDLEFEDLLQFPERKMDRWSNAQIRTWMKKETKIEESQHKIMEASKMDGKALIDMDIAKLQSLGFTSKAKGLVLLRKVSEWLSEYPLT